MNTIVIVIVGIGIAALLGYTFLSTTGYDYFHGITLQLDEMYTNINEMADAVLEELKKQGRKCEIIETGNGYPKFLIDGKKYKLIDKMACVGGAPLQSAQLKLIK